MKIKSVHVKNFRSIQDETLHCDSLTALVGANGSGKSSFLRALDLFYSPSARCDSRDFHGFNEGESIEISITYCNLSADEIDNFGSYVINSELTVVRVFDSSGGKSSGVYYGSRPQHPKFTSLRRMSASELGTAYGEIREQPAFQDLPTARNKELRLQALADWERDHPDQLEYVRDDGQFFGFTNVGAGKLGSATRFVFIPAVRDALDEASDSRGNALNQLMEILVRSALSRKQSIIDLQKETLEKYKQMIDPSTVPELGLLQAGITETLKTYYEDVSVNLDWNTDVSFELPVPSAKITIQEDSLKLPIDRVGHGLQRAFILSLLQRLALARTQELEDRGEDEEAGRAVGDEGAETPGPAATENATATQFVPSLDLILGIEEPELYQHPNRQRHFAKVLLQLADGAITGVAKRTQIIYTTHAPLLIGMDRFDQIRIVRKKPSGLPSVKASYVTRTTVKEIRDALSLIVQGPADEFTTESTLSRLHTVMNPILNEGFFALKCLLVEGESDRAAVLTIAELIRKDLERLGIAVVPVAGKNNMDRPALVFRAFGIPVYLLWDNDGHLQGGSDATGAISANRRLLKIVAGTQTDWPDCVEDKYACLAPKLEVVLRREIGEADYDRILAEKKASMGYSDREKAQKNPVLVSSLIFDAYAAGKRSQTIEAIIEKVIALPAV